MPFRFTRREPIDAGVRRLAEAELAAAAALLRDDTTPAAQRVHGARKATKRVRALLRLARAGLSAQQFRAANLGLRDAARQLSAARDAAVALATFDHLVGDLGPEPDVSFTALRAALAAAAAAPDIGPELLTRAADALDEARARITAALAGRTLTWKHLSAGLEDSYAGGRASMRAAFESQDDEAFHAWRKRIKDLWYQTQLLSSACEPMLAAQERLLADLGDRLGDDHDLAVLAAHPAAADLPALAERITARRASLRRDAWRLGQHIHAERPRGFLRRLTTYWQVWRAEGPT